MRNERNEARRERLRAGWPVNVSDFAAAEGTSVGAIYRLVRELGLPRKKIEKQPLARSHPAVREGRTRFPKRLVTAETSPGLFVGGFENRKIGKRVLKGRWKGMPIYTYTGAERTTCPKSCAVWNICYGNNLNWPRRHVLDRALIERMRWELTALNARHPRGFVVRLHVLGDFGSDTDLSLALAYVDAWATWMRTLPALRVFGFTAWAPDTAVGCVVNLLNRDFADRWRVRFSGHALGGRGALVIQSEADSAHVVCPYETGKVENCASCALCWSMSRTVEFLVH